MKTAMSRRYYVDFDVWGIIHVWQCRGNARKLMGFFSLKMAVLRRPYGDFVVFAVLN